MLQDRSSASDSTADKDDDNIAGLIYPTEVIVEGQQMQKVN